MRKSTRALVVSGLETRFLYDGGQLAAETNASGAILRRYVPGPGVDETLAVLDANGVSYPLNDARNTPMALALPDGALALQGYGAFGEEGGSNLGRIGFTGQMRIPELGLDYYKARFYDPAIGRFLTPDPAGFVDGPNLYAYVLNDPINFTDPSGLYITGCAEIGAGNEVVGSCRLSGSIFDFSAGGNGNISIGSGSFFHFLDPLADNGSATGREEMMARPQDCAARERDLRNRAQTLRGLNRTLSRYRILQGIFGGPAAARGTLDAVDFVAGRQARFSTFAFGAGAVTGGFAQLSSPFQEGRDQLANSTLVLVGEFRAFCASGR